MAQVTGIEWADATANFWIGCTKLSPACDHCYAERDWGEGGLRARVTWGPHGDRSKAKAGASTCRKLQREAADFYAEHGRMRRVFVNSLSDFGDNHRSILPEWRSEFWQIVRECPDLIFLILTKRPQNIPGYLPSDWMWGYPNVWIGTTAENQTEYDRRKMHLEAIPAALRFLSMEPLLSEVQMGDLSKIGWVIAGGESGQGYREAPDNAARMIRDQCATAGVPFLWKQHSGPNTRAIKAKGREIDGVVHDGYPSKGI